MGTRGGETQDTERHSLTIYTCKMYHSQHVACCGPIKIKYYKILSRLSTNTLMTAKQFAL